MCPRDDDHWFEDNELEREAGVLASADGGHKTGCAEDECAPDETVEDPINEPGVPGTVDDLPYDYGVETAQAADETLDSLDGPPARAWRVGAPGPAEQGEPSTLGRPEERELWQKQQPLIEEGAINERAYADLNEEDVPEILEASGEIASCATPASLDTVPRLEASARSKSASPAEMQADISSQVMQYPAARRGPASTAWV
ncbi:MAG: hypothetical protein Q8K89_07190 [Actinomycetota bacterium]|nr:hypothetical protein [Actinomycetota bacterium]